MISEQPAKAAKAIAPTPVFRFGSTSRRSNLSTPLNAGMGGHVTLAPSNVDKTSLW
jgi:hypothetical protein